MRAGIAIGLVLLEAAAGAAARGQRPWNGVQYESNLSTRNVVVIAHEDDWQLFMGDAVSEILKTSAPTVFVYLTAGDDGRDSVYWLTRERAALQSTRTAQGLSATASDSISCAPVLVANHMVRKCSFLNVESYFLRLPDGKRNGTGFTRYAHQSMRALRSGKIGRISAVDGSTIYEGWSDLMSTVDQILNVRESGEILVHTMDPSKAVNPHDHFDHRMAGLIIEELRSRHKLAARYYMGYALATRAPNRTNQQTREKTAILIAYDTEMMRVDKRWSAFRERPSFYSECMTRTYARSPRAPRSIAGQDVR